jgi:hypothetical protein
LRRGPSSARKERLAAELAEARLQTAALERDVATTAAQLALKESELDRRVDESLGKAAALFSSEQREVKKLEERITDLEARLKAIS